MITREEALQTIHDCRITSLGELAHGYTVYQATANILINQLFNQFESQLSSNPLQLTCDGCMHERMKIVAHPHRICNVCCRNIRPDFYKDTK